MNNDSKNKWQIRIATVAIFVLGFLAGALALNSYQIWSRADRPDRGQRMERVFTELQLTEAQKSEANKILADSREKLQALRRESRPRVEEIRREADEKMQKVMTPEQWEKFQQLRRSPRGDRRRGDQNK